MSVTLREISVKCQVSTMTVSRAIRGQKGVSEAVRQKILDAAQELGYDPEAAFHARTLRQARDSEMTPQTQTLALIMPPEAHEDSLSFFGRILGGTRTASCELGYDFLVCNYYERFLPRVVMRGHVDGALRLLLESDMVNGYPECPVPWVSLLHDIPGHDAVLVDNRAAGRAVGAHLYALGHRHIAFIGSDTDLGRERVEGLRAAARDAQAPLPDAHIVIRQWAGGRESTRTLLRELCARTGPFGSVANPVTAIVAYNDFMATVAVQVLREQGLRVPEDMSVAGFDGALPRDIRDPLLTTAALPLEELGAEAVRLLAWRLGTPEADPRTIALRADLRPGSTTAPPPGPLLSRATGAPPCEN